MPSAYDTRPVQVTHSPTARLDTGVGKLKPFGIDQIIDGFVKALKDLTGLDLSSPQAFIESLVGIIRQGGEFVDNFIDIVVSSAAGLFGFATSELSKINLIGMIHDAFAGIDLSAGPGAVLAVIERKLENVPVLGDILRTIRKALASISLIPLTSIGDTQPNLLTEADFATAATIAPGTDFTWDGSDGHTTAGCASTAATGALKSLFSDRISVVSGHKITASAWVKYSAVIAAINSNAIRIELVPYTGDAAGAAVLIGGIASPVGTTTAWTQLSGNYTVPAGIDAVVLALRVTGDATAGTVKFDDALVKKTQRMPQNFVTDLVTDLNTLHNQAVAFLDDIAEKLGVDEWDDWIHDEWQQLLNGVKGGVGGAIDDLIHKLQHLRFDGKFDAGHLIGEVAQDAVSGLTDFVDNAGDALKSFFNTWFGRNDGDGSAAQFTYTVEAIKDAVINGYTVRTFTASEAAWTVPDCQQMTAILIGGGATGVTGSSGGQSSASVPGGAGGSYLALDLDPTALPATLDISIGTAGVQSAIRAANATPHTGALIAQSPPAGNPGGIATTFGYSPTTSLPGAGGLGGGQLTIGGTGGDSAIAAGGVGGSSASGTYGRPGSPGGSVSAGATVKCGGAGGGGGGGSGLIGNGGGNGGAGGYPGGGGGGGGRGYNAAGGQGGPGAIGVVWIYYK